MQSLARAQEKDPVTFPHTADGFIRSDKCGTGIQLDLGSSKACHLTDMAFHPNRVRFHFDIQRRSDDLCRLLCTDKWAADRQVKLRAFHFPALTQCTCLGATRFIERVIRLSLPACLRIPNGFAMAREYKMVNWFFIRTHFSSFFNKYTGLFFTS